MKQVRLKIQRSKRGSENESSTKMQILQEFTVPFEQEMTVLDALNAIKNDQDGTLTFRWSCRMGICGSCGMMVDGRPVLTCQTYVKDLCASEVNCDKCIPEIAVAPLRHFPIIKDLVSDIDDPMEKFRSVMPWSDFQKNNVATRDKSPSRPEARMEPISPRSQSPKELAKIGQTSQCVKCMLCYSACPVYGLDKSFIGPAAGALAYRYQADSRDTPSSAPSSSEKHKRMDTVTAKDGVWKCSFVGECSVVCPKRVDPALALQRLKLMGLKHILNF